MRYIQNISREQTRLLPYSVEEMVEETNPVRVIHAYVDSLPMETLGFERAEPAQTGRPAYDPRDLLKLYIYGYLNRIRSSRKLMTECRRNVELFYLLNMLRPDFRTIADFRKRNRKALKEVFRDFVKACAELKLLGKETVAIDGTKIRASNSKKKSYTPEILEKKIEYLEEQERGIEEYLEKMDKADQEEKRAPVMDIKPEDMPQKLEQIRERVAKYKGYQKRMKETGETQILETDPECRTIHTKEGQLPAYNIQTAVDDRHHLIVSFETTNANTDQGLLDQMAEQTKEEMGVETIEVLADKGYESRQDIEKCVMHGTVPNVGYKYDKDERIFDLEYIPNEIDEQTRCSEKPEDIQKCLHAGVLPRCYEGTSVEVQLQKRSVMSCFIRHEDGRVTCPMGRELFKHSVRKHGTIYGSREACRTCPNRCTDSKNAKTVSIGHNTNIVAVRMYGNPEYPLQRLPEGFVPHNSIGRPQKPERVRLILRRNPDDMQRRKELVEHPFGTIKWYDGAHYFLCRGKEMVSAEIALSFLTYNLRRAIRILGVGALVAHFNARNQKNRVGIPLCLPLLDANLCKIDKKKV